MEKYYHLIDFIYDKAGLAGVLLSYFLFDKILWPRIKRRWFSNGWIDLKEVQANTKGIRDLKEDIGGLGRKFNLHIDKADERNITIAEIRKDIDNAKELNDKENNHMFHQLDSIFKKIDDNHTEIMRIMLEKK